MKKITHERMRPNAAKASELASARTAKLKSEKRLIDLRYRREAGELCEIADVKAAWTETIIRLRQLIDSIELPLIERNRIRKQATEILRDPGEYGDVELKPRDMPEPEGKPIEG